MPEPKRHLLSGTAFVHVSRMIQLGEAMRIELTVDHHWKFAEMLAFMLQRTKDALEGPKAFAEKREPEWKMR
jgi:1,4-dihydroxy-2-naphthoyl-CoA synthase